MQLRVNCIKIRVKWKKSMVKCIKIEVNWMKNIVKSMENRAKMDEK